MKIFSFINEKGGVGKTKTACTIAAGLAARGYRVLLIDTDEQGHVATSFGYAKEAGLFELLARGGDWAAVLRGVPPERYQVPGTTIPERTNLHYVPSNLETRALPYVMSPSGTVLRQRLDQVQPLYDVCVIDTAPAASLLHILIYVATDYVVYPTRPEYLSMDGLVTALAHLDTANAIRQQAGLAPIELAGILPTMYRRAVQEHRDNVADIRKRYGDKVWEPIPLATAWDESLGPSSGFVPVYAYDAGSPAAADAWALVDRVQAVLPAVQLEFA
jgi:chromosome partitioning protein